MAIKKGFFFTFFVITALSLVVLTYKIGVEYKEADRAEVIKKRVEQTNKFVEDIDSDMDKALFISAFRSMLAMDEYIKLKNDFIRPPVEGVPDEALSRLVVNGTVREENSAESSKQKFRNMETMDGSTIAQWIGNVNELAKPYKVRVSFPDSIDVRAVMISPWEVNFSLETDVSVMMLDNDVFWNFSVSKFAIVSIVGFPDPFYHVGSIKNYADNSGTNEGDVKPLLNTIRVSPYDFSFAQTTITPFFGHATGQYYYSSQLNAPDYFSRLRGDYDAEDNFGIESFVNVSASNAIFSYSSAGTSTCATDYQFFGSSCSDADKENLNGMSSRFYIDGDGVDYYNLHAFVSP